MSASPSGPTSNGRVPTPNGGQPQFIRRPRPADPLRQNRRKPQRQPAVSKSSASKPNGLKPTSKPAQPYRGAAPRTTSSSSFPSNGVTHSKTTSEFTQVPEGPYQDFPLFATKKAPHQGLRHHVARFATKKAIDPSNQNDFARPVSLHRRDPRQPPPGKVVKDEDLSTGLPLDDKEQEKLELARLEKEAQKAADLAQIAPTGNTTTTSAAKKSAAFRSEKTTQVHRLDKTEEEKKESDLRYEEALPWHLEDAENKHTWVGNYEAALSDINVILVIEGSSFKMIPIEKWYKFTPKNQFKTLTIEEAEAQMKQKSKVSRWVMHTQQMQQQDAEMQATRRQLGNMYKVKGESSTFRKSAKSETREADDLDFDDGDLFADDDEQPTAEPEKDEDTKYAAEKIKREQLGANLFGEADEAEVEKELEEEEKQAEEKKKLGKKMKKALQKREKNYLYDSDSSHPYSSSSEDDTSDEEKKKEEQKKEDETKLKAKAASSKVPSGASTKGTNTPSSRPKQGDQSKRPNHLKRVGSPNLSASETSGDEFNRRKLKKKHLGSTQPTGGTSTPVPTSRPISPAPSSQLLSEPNRRKSPITKLNVNSSKSSEIQSSVASSAAPMSDGESTTGAVSLSRSRAGSPVNGSRAGSPAAVAGNSGSPQQASTPGPSTMQPSAPQRPKPVAPEEIATALPPGGISISALLKLFPGRVVDKKDRERFIRIVKDNSSYSQDDKLLRPKT